MAGEVTELVLVVPGAVAIAAITCLAVVLKRRSRGRSSSSFGGERAGDS